jgi:hypothetical protein
MEKLAIDCHDSLTDWLRLAKRISKRLQILNVGVLLAGPVGKKQQVRMPMETTVSNRSKATNRAFSPAERVDIHGQAEANFRRHGTRNAEKGLHPFNQKH